LRFLSLFHSALEYTATRINRESLKAPGRCDSSTNSLPPVAVVCRSLPLAATLSACQDQSHINEHGGVIMKQFLSLTLLLVISSAGFAQQNPQLPHNKELVSRARSFYVQSDTFYMKREALESSLLGQAEFKAWDLQITGNEALADMLIKVKRVPFSNHFSYTVTDRGTDTIVMAGKVDSLAGTVYGQIAKEIVEKMVRLRGDPLPAQKSQDPAATK
jgi:hypothetical protein